MTDGPDRRPTWLSSRLSLSLVVTLTLVYGIVLRVPVATAIGLIGAGGIINAAESVTNPDASRRDRAMGSVGLAISALVVLVAGSLIGARVVWLPLASVVLVGFSGSDAIFGGENGELFSVCGRSRDVLAVAGVVLALVQTGLLWESVALTTKTVTDTFDQFLGFAILALEGLIYVVASSLPVAQRELDERVGSPQTEQFVTVSVGGRQVDEALIVVREWFHSHLVLVFVQAVALLFGSGYVESVLWAGQPVGPAIAAVFTSGILHLLLALIAIVAVFVIVGAKVHEWITATNAFDPPAAAAGATGGFVIATVVTPVSMLFPRSFQSLLAGAIAGIAGVVGPGAALLWFIAGVLMAVSLSILVTSLVAWLSSLASLRTSGSFVSAVLVLVAAVAAAETGISAVIVFASVAVAVLVWDLGEQASYLGVTIDESGRSDEAEAVHAMGAIGVGVAAVAVASGASYLLEPLSIASDQATVALVLSLVAVLLFVVPLEW